MSSKFVDWNTRLLTNFFSPASRGEEVWLHVTPSELDAIGPDLGGDEGFKLAVRSGPPWEPDLPADRLTRAWDFTECAIRLHKRRIDKRCRMTAYVDPGSVVPTYAQSSAPTYLPFLAALVRSAAEHGEAGFYAHLQEQGLVPTGWHSPQMAQIEVLWRDLEEWTDETRGAFGRFKFRQLGGFNRIGIPRSQSIVSRRDSELMPRVFVRIGARPGQAPDKLNAKALIEHLAEAHFLSKPLRTAAVRSEFAEIVVEKARSIFEDWDGSVDVDDKDAALAGTTTRRRPELTLVLSVSMDHPPRWRVQWRIPPMSDAGKVVLSAGGFACEAIVDGVTPATTPASVDPVYSALAMGLLRDSAGGAIEFSACLERQDAEDAEVETFPFIFPSRLLRSMVFEFEPNNGCYELRERALPLHGHAYLLAVPSNAARLQDFLARNEIDHMIPDVAGLPSGWLLACITACERLTSEQRATLPDGEDGSRAQPRAVKLVGGRSLNRGGVRQYLRYDLPWVELDAPPGTILAATGLEIEEESGDQQGLAALRRFRLTILDPQTHCFVLQASNGGILFGEARLRIATEQGVPAAIRGSFSLDEQGGPTQRGTGLLGIMRGTESPPVEAAHGKLVAVDPRASAVALAAAYIDDQLALPAIQFLDSLAQVGPIGYGVARAQLTRLASRKKLVAHPAQVLMALRARGHLEIETNAKGYIARIYPVPPRLIPLAVGSPNSVTWWGVQGSLTLDQWRRVASAAHGHEVFRHPSRKGDIQDWLLRVSDSKISSHLRDAGLEAVDAFPAQAIADWSASLTQVRERYDNGGVESLGKGQEDIERLVPNEGLFKRCADLAVDPAVGCRLFRMKDLDTGQHKLYALGVRIAGGQSQRYSFVRDSRWGVWTACAAFANFVKTTYGVQDASPWPVPYLCGTGTVLLPARMSLPVILERALTVCAAAAPEVLELAGRVAGDKLDLVSVSDEQRVGSVSRVYEGMAKGRWLAYHWVPFHVAECVAQKIGGAVHEVH